MIMVYLLFVMSIFFIRFFAGYDSRYQSGKYISIKSSVLRVLLMDNTSFFVRTKRLKKDRNKLSFCSIPFYAFALLVFLINLAFLFISDIPIEPWVIETDKFIVYANTLNDKISAISMMLLFSAVMCYIPLASIRSVKKAEKKWIKWLILIVFAILIFTAVILSIYYLIELVSSLSNLP